MNCVSTVNWLNSIRMYICGTICFAYKNIILRVIYLTVIYLEFTFLGYNLKLCIRRDLGGFNCSFPFFKGISYLNKKTLYCQFKGGSRHLRAVGSFQLCY